MVFEWLVDVHKIEYKPWKMFFFGFAYSAIAAGFALLLLPKFAGPVMLAFTMVAFMPLMTSLMREEELRDEVPREKVGKWFVEGSLCAKIFGGHCSAVKFFLFMFAGMLSAYTALFIILPQSYITNLFSMQLQIITSRNVSLGAFIGVPQLLSIIVNNMKVLLIGLVLAFVYGAGAIFILSWNATLLGTLVGSIVKSAIENSVAPVAMGRFLLHGIPEITAYFIIGLAGSIISIAASNHKFLDEHFRKVAKDSLTLILVSIGLLIAAALLEVYVSPLINF